MRLMRSDHSRHKGKSEQELEAVTWKQELKQKPWRNAALARLSRLALPSLLDTPGLHASNWHHPQWAGPFHISRQLIKKMLDRLTNRLAYGGFFSIKIPSS